MRKLLRNIAMLKVVSRANALKHTSGCRHACHVMIHAPVPSDGKVFGRYPIGHAVLMQMRFDGRFGFPGGYVDGGETLEDAVNREVQEELGSTSSPVGITSEDYVVSHFYDVNSENLYLHFFAKKVTLSQFMELEKRSESLPHYGYEEDQSVLKLAWKMFCYGEQHQVTLSKNRSPVISLLPMRTLENQVQVLGLVRVPLYILRDRQGGLPAFLQNNFIGNARDQLIIGLEVEKLLSKKEIEEVMQIIGGARNAGLVT